MKPLSLSVRIAAAVLFSITLQNAGAEIYKWTDAEGNTHYTQTPPPANEVKAEDVQNIEQDIEMATGLLGNTTPTESTAEEDEMASARAAGKANTIKHQTFCDQQKAALKQLLSNPVIRWKSADKTERILSAAERKAKIDEFNGNIKEMCNAEVLATKQKIDVN